MVVVDIQGKLRLALGSVKDHASIGKAMITCRHYHDGFSGIEIAVVRATGHDNGTIDDRYMHEILFLVSNSPGSIPFLAEKISRRLHKTKDRLVALKTLILLHRLLRGGNRRFEQDLCQSHFSGHLQIAIRSSPRNNSSSEHPSVLFLRRYASYLEERMNWVINQAGKLEPIMSKGLEFRRYDEKSIDMVFRILPKCQVLIDRVLDCSDSVGDVLPYDVLAQTAMSNILRESFQVYRTFSEGVGALVNMFFDLRASARGMACEILKKACVQSQSLHELYQICKKMVGNKNLEYPCVQIMSTDHVMALELAVTETERRKNKEEEEGEKKIIDVSLSPSTTTLFSWTVLETKISKVWVVFEDDENPSDSSQVLPLQNKTV